MTNDYPPTVLVVGAAGGIGLEIVKQLVPNISVMAVVLNEEQSIQARDAGVKSTFICDVSNSDMVEATLTAINTELANLSLTAVIYCAAIQPAVATEVVQRKTMEQLFAVNLFGTLQMVQGLLPALRKSQGRLVLFSSMAGKVASPLLGPYAASKFALEALADALRREMKGSGIDISLIEPGGVRTALAFNQQALITQGLSQLSEEHKVMYESLYLSYSEVTSKALQKASTPEDIAKYAVTAAIGPGKPRKRYAAGKDAKIIISLSKILPAVLMDKLLIKCFSNTNRDRFNHSS